MSQQLGLGLMDEAAVSGLSAVFARFERSEPYTPALFDGFSTLRVLTYSASIPTVARELPRFDYVECVFGFEGILHDFSDILACQKTIQENLVTAIKGMDDARKQAILARVAAGQARFYVVKDAVAHAKLYLLEGEGRRRVIVGSANWSERAFSGKQAETIIVFDDDEAAWEHFDREYRSVRGGATSEMALDSLEQRPLRLEDVPLIQEAGRSRGGVTLFVNNDVQVTSVPAVIRSVERLAGEYRPLVQGVAPAKKGKVLVTREVVGKVVNLVRAQKREEGAEEPTWFSINRESGKAILNGEELSLATDPAEVAKDTRLLIDYFNNFEHGFHGDVAQHQRDYFLFMAWLYFSPFVCDLRNRAIVEQDYIFDYPLFAVLYGKSNCGKTRLIETLLRSMFGQSRFIEKNFFTRTNLRGLLHTQKRYPAVFDDVEKQRFTQHASDIIKDETFMLEEYPAFVLSMNAEDHSFSTEIRKRCLILYTRASLPDNTEEAKALYRSVRTIQDDLGTALYREYLRRAFQRLADDPSPRDMLRFSSQLIVELMAEAHDGALPHWCAVASMSDYQGRKYDKIRAELLKLFETSPDLWEVRRHEVILRVPSFESHGLRKEIPDWLLKEGSKGGTIVLERGPLEQFIGRSLERAWWRRWGK